MLGTQLTLNPSPMRNQPTVPTEYNEIPSPINHSTTKLLSHPISSSSNLELFFVTVKTVTVKVGTVFTNDLIYLTNIECDTFWKHFRKNFWDPRTAQTKMIHRPIRRASKIAVKLVFHSNSTKIMNFRKLKECCVKSCLIFLGGSVKTVLRVKRSSEAILAIFGKSYKMKKD